jgi:HPr kinase/phosphorylase
VKRQITVEDLLKERETDLALENFTPTAGLHRPITHPNPTSPGLALAGFMERVRDGRAQVFGETEMAYLEHLDPEMAEERLNEFFHHEIPVVFVT